MMDGGAVAMVLDATLNNISVISWRSVLLVEGTGGPGENHWSVASHWQTLSQYFISSRWWMKKNLIQKSYLDHLCKFWFKFPNDFWNQMIS